MGKINDIVHLRCMLISCSHHQKYYKVGICNMNDPKVTEYTTVHVDESLDNEVSVRTQVRVFKPEGRSNQKGDNAQQKYDAHLVDEDYALKQDNIAPNEMSPVNENGLKLKQP